MLVQSVKKNKGGQSWGVVRTLGKALLWKPHSTKDRGKESREARNQTDGLQLMFFIAWESHKQKAVVAWRRYNMWAICVKNNSSLI